MTKHDPSPFDAAAIERIANGVLDLSLPYEEWSHAAHFAAALWLLRHPDVLAGAGGIEAIIRRYNKAVGIPDIPTRGYHDTITRASIRAASHVLGRHAPDAPLDIVLADLMNAEFGDRAWLLAYWREDLLMGIPARQAWVEPDLAPFPY